MFTMRRPSYSSSTSFAYTAPAAPRCSSGHGTSSAFSASAHPNEDWTKIADLAERRRIQNRIAQRNYRKKQRRRMEDLERRAGSSSASPPTRYQEPVPFPQDQQREDIPVNQQIKQERISSNRYSPSPPQDDAQAMFAAQYNRQLSTSPPPFGYTLYAAPEQQSMYPSYSQQTSYSSMPTCGGADVPLDAQFLPQLPSTYGSNPGATKSDGLYAEDDSMSPFSVSYAAMAGTGMSMAQALNGASAQTPPLSDCFDSSLGGSPADSGIMFPLTPLSIPTTPPTHLM